MRQLLVSYVLNWSTFDPKAGHAFSGRNNDGDAGNIYHFLSVILGAMGESANIGLRTLYSKRLC
jgi:hypothetical protein